MESVFGKVQWDIGLAENRNKNNYKIPLKLFYRVRVVFAFSPGKLRSSPYTPAELRS